MKRILYLLAMLLIVSTKLSAQTATQPSGSGTSGDPYLIATLDNLYWVTQNPTMWSSYFKQTADIDATTTNTWDHDNGLPMGFSPIGTNWTDFFSGTYDGNGKKIINLYINRPYQSFVGFIGYLIGGSVFNLGLVNTNITGYNYTGALVGSGTDFSAPVSNCYTKGKVSGNQYVGGIMGFTQIAIPGTITLKQCYSTSSVSGDSFISGLLGSEANSENSELKDCFSTGTVTVSSDNVFGIGSGSMTNYTRCYFSGKVNAPYRAFTIYGFSAYNTQTNCYYNSTLNPATNDLSQSSNAEPKSTAEMQTQSTFSGYDFTNVWSINSTNNGGYPYLINTPLVETTVTGFTPASAGDGNTVTITGTNFYGTTAVKFGGISCSFTVVNPTTITAIVVGAVSGSVSVITSCGTASLSGFSYIVAPTNLSYTTSNVFTKDIAITPLTPTVTGVVTSYSVTPALPAGLNLNTTTGVISGTPTALSALTAYTVKATNISVSTTKVINITVKGMVAPTNLSYTTPNFFAKDVAITPLTPTVTGVVTSYSVSPALPAGLSLNTTTGIISGTPAAINALTDYTITAANGTGSTTKLISIEVTDGIIPDAPADLWYYSPSYFTVGYTIEDMVPYIDGGQADNFSVYPNLPAGLTLNATTGVISGTPTEYSPDALYAVTATNAGGSSICYLEIDVASNMYPIYIAPPTNGTITVMNGDTPVNDGDYILGGTNLTVFATPDNGYVLSYLAVNGYFADNGSSVSVWGYTTVEAYFDVAIATGVNTGTVSGVAVYPTITHDNVTVKFAEALKVEVMNSTGTLLLQQPALNATELSVNMGKYTPGMYLIKVTLKTGQTVVKRVIVH